MKTSIQSLAFFLLAMAALSCKPRQVPANADTQTVPTEAHTCAGTLSRGQATFKDPLTSFTGQIEGDCLELQCAGSGGCKKHDLQLFWSGDWAESIPPVAQLYLSHNANEDACEAIWNEKLHFDLHPLRYAGLGQVALDIHAAGQPVLHLNYIYPSK